jgi:cell division protein ZapA
MAEVDVRINGKAYTLACEDGQEAHLKALAAKLDGHAQGLAAQMGTAPESRLMLMTALMAADEAAEAQSKMAAMEAELANVRQNGHAVAEDDAPATAPSGDQPSLFNSDAEQRVATLLVGAADRLDAIAERLERSE